jgi:hypothetical protein
MHSWAARACSGVAILFALSLAGPAPQVAAQESPAPASSDAPRPHKSVYGKLSSVDQSLNGVIMRSDDGQKLAWRFDKRVIAEAAKFKKGDPLIVIYRQISPSEKRVTAVAFPGSADKPTYVNTTGSRVMLRSSPMVDGRCDQMGGGPVTDSTLPIGGVAEVMEGCWCCAVAGESCTPSNKSGAGRALLVNCFK